MLESFIYKDSHNTSELIPKKSKLYASIINDYPDFVYWSWTVFRIPFYQSLGDTIGYYNGHWEFNYGDINAGPEIINDMIYEFISLGGINNLSITNWMASDDTILYMTTMEILTQDPDDIQDFGKKLRDAYVDVKPLIENRDPGQITIDSLSEQEKIKWDHLPYDKNAIGNGSTMRSGCIGFFFPGKINRINLIALAIESSRITHNSTIANLGSVTAALFTAYALEKISINLWPHKLIKLLESDKIDNYMKENRPNEYSKYKYDKILFVGKWKDYLKRRFSGINPRLDIRFMKNPVQRYKYLIENFSKGCDKPGSCADDVLILAYDALLQSDGVLEKIIIFSTLHPGDSDTVGSIALSWFGAYYHSIQNEILTERFFKELEFQKKLNDFFQKNIERLVYVYYHDIYISIASNYYKKYENK